MNVIIIIVIIIINEHNNIRNENDLKNEIKIVQTISKNINMNFGLGKCARICLKRGRVQSKMHKKHI